MPEAQKAEGSFRSNFELKVLRSPLSSRRALRNHEVLTECSYMFGDVRGRCPWKLRGKSYFDSDPEGASPFSRTRHSGTFCPELFPILLPLQRSFLCRTCRLWRPRPFLRILPPSSASKDPGARGDALRCRGSVASVSLLEAAASWTRLLGGPGRGRRGSSAARELYGDLKRQSPHPACRRRSAVRADSPQNQSVKARSSVKSWQECEKCPRNCVIIWHFDEMH